MAFISAVVPLIPRPYGNSAYGESSDLVPVRCILRIRRETIDISIWIPQSNILNHRGDNSFIAEIFVPNVTENTNCRYDAHPFSSVKTIQVDIRVLLMICF